MSSALASGHFCPLSNAHEEFRLLRFEEPKERSILSCWLEPFAFPTVDYKTSVNGRTKIQTLEATTKTDVSRAFPAPSPRYAALSYMWGEATSTEKIVINGAATTVGANCVATLRQIAALSLHDYFWIDAICIDQSDDREKSLQVRRMGEIFERAARVYACPTPGIAREPRVDAMSWILEKLRHRATESSNYGWRDIWDRALEAQGRQRVVNGLWYLVSSPYWSRLWIVQELAFPGNVDLLFAGKIVPMVWFREIYALLEKDLEQCKADESALAFYDVTNATTNLGPSSLDSTLKIFGAFQCLDPRDRIYGLDRLVKWPPEIGPIMSDYTISTFELCTKASLYVRDLAALLRALNLSALNEEILAAKKLRQRPDDGAGNESSCNFLFENFDVDQQQWRYFRPKKWAGNRLAAAAAGSLYIGTDEPSRTDDGSATNGEETDTARNPLDLSPENSHSNEADGPHAVRCQRLSWGSRGSALIGSRAKPGDVVVWPTMDTAIGALGEVGLILREHANRHYEIVDQVLRPKHNQSCSRANTCACDKRAEALPLPSVTDVQLWFDPEDAIVFFGQDLISPGNDEAEHLFLERLRTRVCHSQFSSFAVISPNGFNESFEARSRLWTMQRLFDSSFFLSRFRR